MVAVSGLEVLLERPPDVVRGQRLGLVTNPAAVDRDLRLSIDRLWRAGFRGGRGAEPARRATKADPEAWRLTRLFGPEHGVRGDVLAGGRVPDGEDPLTGLPVSSLYGPELRPTAAMLADVDVLVIDLQDVGARFYTYQSTVAGCLQSGAEHGRPVLVLDRPNPVGGLAVEGPLLEAGYESFLGRRGQPVRHGLSLGELARATNEAEGIGADLTVLPVEGWRRAQWWDETGLPWVIPSPNLPTLDTATVYPGTCLLEGTLLSEGRGTTRPFEVLGAPWIEPYRWAEALTERGLPGVRFRPLWFQPVAAKHAGVRCGGVQVHVADREAFRPVATGVHLIETARRLWPAEFGWRGGGQAGAGSRPARRGAFPEGGPRQAPQAGKVLAIDRLYGGPALRERIDAGEGAEAIVASWDVAPFEVLRRRALLYE